MKIRFSPLSHNKSFQLCTGCPKKGGLLFQPHLEALFLPYFWDTLYPVYLTRIFLQFSCYTSRVYVIDILVYLTKLAYSSAHLYWQYGYSGYLYVCIIEM